MQPNTDTTLDEFLERCRKNGADELADAFEHLHEHEKNWDDLAESFEYLIQNQEAYLNGDIDMNTLPVDYRGEVLLRLGIMFGLKWDELENSDE